MFVVIRISGGGDLTPKTKIKTFVRYADAKKEFNKYKVDIVDEYLQEYGHKDPQGYSSDTDIIKWNITESTESTFKCENRIGLYDYVEIKQDI